jgi:hypothetical protein
VIDLLRNVVAAVLRFFAPRAVVAAENLLLRQAKLRDLLPDRMLAVHPDLHIGDPDALPIPTVTRALAP